MDSVSAPQGIYAQLASSLSAAGSAAKVLTPGMEGYEASIKRWSETCEKRAHAVILVDSPASVSTVLNFAQTHSTPLVIRGGAHSTSHSSSTSSGLVIDLSPLRTVTINPTSLPYPTITAGGGATWEDVDVAAAKHGLATVGGTVNHTGIGGLTLGGGYGHLTGRYGLTIDNLVEVEIVLASGEVVRASEKENEELFWAVRGAGAAFGVVTEFVYRGHEQRTPVFGGMLIFPVEKLGGVVAFANAFHEKNDGNQTLMFGWSAPHGEPAVLVVFFHNGTKEEGESFFKELVELGPVVNTAREMPYEKLNGMLNDAMGWGGRKIFGGGNFTLPLDVAVVEKLKNEFFGFLDARERMGESALLFECIPYKKVLEVSNSAMAFANRGQYYNVATCFKWYDEALDAEVRAFSRELLTRASEEAGVWKGGRGKGGVGQYANYSTAESKAEELFGGNTGRLLELKGRFDPRNVFSTHRLGMVGEGVVG